MKTINIKGARTHNLKNIDVSIPHNQLVVITGLSGSGKSSLSFNTIYAEGQRRYVESLSAYARQFLSVMEKPDVDYIEGLSPTISIEQKSISHNPRSTVGTITEIHDYLRLLFARVGQPRCPQHHIALEAQTISQMVDTVMQLPKETRLMILAPIIQERKGEHTKLIENLCNQGFVRARIDGKIIELDQPAIIDAKKKHTIEVVVDRIKIRNDIQLRLTESFETAQRLTNGLITVAFPENSNAPDLVFSSKYTCTKCGYSLAELEPRLFSFNNPKGACPSCSGLGYKEFFDEERVIHHPNLSLADGAIRGWDRHNVHYFHILKSLSEHYKFDVETPFNQLPQKIQQIILYGSGFDKIRIRYINEKGSIFQHINPFEGIIPNMQRRYRETDSEAVRENLARYLTTKPCDVCQGTRLCTAATHVFIEDVNLPTISEMPIQKVFDFFTQLTFSGYRQKIAERILKEICDRLQFLMSVGLNYLTLDRKAETLSGGEAQRIRLASQIGSGLVGVTYILDEPSIGLHQRDNERLLKTLTQLRDLGNTVIVIEHDETAIKTADWVIDLGPGAGVNGGQIVTAGIPSEIIQHSKSLTGQYLSGKQKIDIPEKRHSFNPQKRICLKGARCNNLKNIHFEVPVGLLTCITGVSGSGKSSLINDTLYPIVESYLNNKTILQPKLYDSITGLELLDKVIDINQSPIGRTPRSNPSTYTGIFSHIRELFAQVPEARSRGYKAGRFSFNVKGGRCEACQGCGVTKVEMHFLADMYVTCDVCQGNRYNRETLDIKYKGKNIHQILEMTILEACDFFGAIPPLAHKLQTLIDVGLSYIRLGQSALTLSGGEAQRVKLARELSKRDTGKTLYLLDEPTTGLHFHDIKQLLTVLHRLRDCGNTIVIIEHNLDVIKTADWIVDLGPEGGEQGGEIVTFGTPDQVAQCNKSHTGQFLSPILYQ
jgi:excinuclease ABC subunit A